ncbi:hypothetical protein [Methylobacterium durans]|nr:hypothetical protein [Methylobacterium durans]
MAKPELTGRPLAMAWRIRNWMSEFPRHLNPGFDGEADVVQSFLGRLAF